MKKIAVLSLTLLLIFLVWCNWNNNTYTSNNQQTENKKQENNNSNKYIDPNIDNLLLQLKQSEEKKKKDNNSNKYIDPNIDNLLLQLKQSEEKEKKINTAKTCNIKWNISYKTQEKIYHMPWCSHYNDTKINTDYWEMWFCSEQEAKNAWWRKCKEY